MQSITNRLSRWLCRDTDRTRVYPIDGRPFVHDLQTMVILKARHGFGDNLMVTAVLEAVSDEYPNLKIVVLAKHPELFLNNPRVYVCFDVNKIPRRDPVLKAAADLEYGDYFNRSWKKTNRVHLIDGLYDCLPLPISTRLYNPKIYLTEQERQFRAGDIADLRRPLVAISPYGKKVSEIVSKIYPLAGWEAIVKSLLSKGIIILQLGVTSEGPLLEGCHDWRDMGYRHTAVVLSRCDMLVTHPGGIMHLAAACDTPCVAIFGGIEDPRLSGYPQNRNIAVTLDCVPCWRKTLCKKAICMEQMPPERIVRETIEALKSRGFESL